MKYPEFVKYERTPHIIGSGVQSDDIKETIPLSFFKGKYLVVEQKFDGGNAGFRFDDEAHPFIQSRGHYLLGGDDQYWSLLKQCIQTNRFRLFDCIDLRFVVFIEWMRAYHSVFYDQLPSYSLEFDIYDTIDHVYLSTDIRNEYLKDVRDIIPTMQVLVEGYVDNDNFIIGGKQIYDWVSVSDHISPNAYNILKQELEKHHVEGSDVLLRLNKDRLCEGLYIKWEEDGIVKGRYKYVRPEFVNAITEQGIHWKKRCVIYNRLR